MNITDTEVRNMATQLRDLANGAAMDQGDFNNLLHKVANHIDPPRPVTEWSDGELVAHWRDMKIVGDQLTVNPLTRSVFNEIISRFLNLPTYTVFGYKAMPADGDNFSMIWNAGRADELRKQGWKVTTLYARNPEQ